MHSGYHSPQGATPALQTGFALQATRESERSKERSSWRTRLRTRHVVSAQQRHQPVQKGRVRVLQPVGGAYKRPRSTECEGQPPRTRPTAAARPCAHPPRAAWRQSRMPPDAAASQRTAAAAGTRRQQQTVKTSTCQRGERGTGQQAPSRTSSCPWIHCSRELTLSSLPRVLSCAASDSTSATSASCRPQWLFLFSDDMLPRV